MTFLRRPHPWIGLWVPLAMLAVVPLLSDWLENQYQVTIQDLLVPLVFALLTATLVSAVFYRAFLRERLAAYVGALLSVVVLSNEAGDKLGGIYPLLQAIDPIPSVLRESGLEPVVIGAAYVALVMALAWRVGKLVGARPWRTDLAGGLTVMVAVVFGLQACQVGRVAVAEWPQFFYRPPALASAAAAGAAKPDIYYIVLDRYASQSVLQDQLGFDNSSFTSYLSAEGFSVNPDAHQNYPYTTMSISSTLNASYHTDMVASFAEASYQTVQPYHDAIRNSSVISQLKQLGYSYDLIGNWYETSNESPLADSTYQQNGNLTVLGRTTALDSFAQDELAQNIFWPAVTTGMGSLVSYSEQDQKDQTVYQLDTLKSLATQGNGGGRVIFAHILVPHDPYNFNADGSVNVNSGSDSNGEPIKAKYVNAVQYINGQMEQVLSDIQKQSDGKAVVILQSDEGPYPMQLNDGNYDGSSVGEELSDGNMNDWSQADLEMKYGILAAYHVPQASAADLSAGGDSVNIFRVVLNAYFSAGLPYLPRCYYDYPNGRSQSFVFTDITERLTGTANAACPAS